MGKRKGVLQPKSQTSPFTLLEKGRVGTRLYFSFTLTLNRAALPPPPPALGRYLKHERPRGASRSQPRRAGSGRSADPRGAQPGAAHARPTTNFRGRGTSSTRGGTTGRGSRRDSGIPPPTSGSVPRPSPTSAGPSAPGSLPSPRHGVPPRAPHTHPGCGAAGGGRRRGRKRPKRASGCGRDPETSWRGPPSRSGRGEEERGAERPLPASAAGARVSGLRRVAVPPPAPSSPPSPARARQDRPPAPGRGGGEAECGRGALWRAAVAPPHAARGRRADNITNPRSGLWTKCPTRKPKAIPGSTASHNHHRTSSICYQNH